LTKEPYFLPAAHPATGKIISYLFYFCKYFYKNFQLISYVLFAIYL